MTIPQASDKMAVYMEVIRNGNEGELLEVLRKINADFIFMASQVESMRMSGRLSFIPQNDSAILGVESIKGKWSSLFLKCLQMFENEGRVRELLLVGEGIPCLEWMKELRVHLRRIKDLMMEREK